MKKLYTFFALLMAVGIFLPRHANTQSPDKISYQAVIRDADNHLITNSNVGLRIAIIQGSAGGAEVYAETHQAVTNNNGLISIEIGGGTVVSGSFQSIDWSDGPYFIRTAVDPSGGANYTIEGTSQILSVPYALHARFAGSAESANITGDETAFEGWDKDTGDDFDGDYLNLFNTPDLSDTVRYLKTESDPLFEAWDKSTGISITESQVSDLQSYLTTETDPVFGSSAASGITETDIAAWDNKLDSYTETDPWFSAWDRDYNDLINQPDKWDSTWTSIKGKPVFATIATSGSYNDLSDAPSIIDSINNVLDVTTQFIRYEEDGDPNNELQGLWEVLNRSNDGGANQIKNIADPTEGQDAVTKAYVDALEAKVTSMEDMLVDAGLYTVCDIDGNKYHVVKIGDQYWMKENLKTTRFRDGSEIPLVTDDTEWSNLTTPGYCWYNNDCATYSDPYGALYNWYTVDACMLCPEGWHVPTNAEWNILTDYLGGWDVAGGKLKEAGTEHWNSPNEGATNEVGFTALPGGCRDKDDGSFFKIGNGGHLWCSSNYNLMRFMFYLYDDVKVGGNSEKYGYSVRCIRD
jgi:uncharacterized protein (TIGR02145 family)